MKEKIKENDSVFKKLNQVIIASHPVRFKILLALYLSESRILSQKRKSNNFTVKDERR